MNTNIIMLDDLIVETCEAHGWTVHEYPEGHIDLAQYTPAGEDFVFTVSSGTDLIQEVREYAAAFNPDEHAEFWVCARENGGSGIPSIRELIEDADALDKMLQDLAIALSRIEDKVQYTIPLF